MKRLSLAILIPILALLFGCSSIVVEDDDPDVATTDQALTADDDDPKSCEDRCMDEFHACRESPDRGGGPGASACAHQKNDCKAGC